MLRWGILGCANIALRAMLPAFELSRTGRVAAIASRSETKAREAAERFAIPRAYGSYAELLADPDIDAVYLPLPNHLHRDWTIRAAEAGKHVLCEKPFALNSREAKEMAAACERSGVLMAEAFMYRHNPRYAKIREMLNRGDIGDIRAIHAAFTFDASRIGDNYRFYPAMGGGALYDVGCYTIHAARLLLAAEPEAATVLAFMSPEHGDVEMMASGLLEFPGRVALTFQCGMWAAPQNMLRIIGTDGSVEVPSAFLSKGQTTFTVSCGGGKREIELPLGNDYVAQIDAFGDALSAGRPYRYDPMDPVRNMEALEACLASARERSRVAIRRVAAGRSAFAQGAGPHLISNEARDVPNV